MNKKVKWIMYKDIIPPYNGKPLQAWVFPTRNSLRKNVKIRNDYLRKHARLEFFSFGRLEVK